jgi:putative DNA primase/helicase
MHYDHHRGRWYVSNENQGRWVRNETRVAFHYARELCREFNSEEKKEFARARTYGAIEQIAENSTVFAVTSDFWDRDIWLLGTPGGTVDLRTGELRPSRKEDYITKSTAVAPDFDANKSVFDHFLQEITLGDDDLQRYLQRIFGYSLTGSTREQKLFFAYGPGGNGKSVLVNTCGSIMGDYPSSWHAMRGGTK